MSSLTVAVFAGMVPLLNSRLLNDQQATEALDVRSRTGALEARNGDTFIGSTITESDAPSYVFRLYDSDTDTSAFMTFDTPNVDVVRGPLINDIYDRYYWASDDGPPGFNTAGRILANVPGYRLGMLPPELPYVATVRGDVNPDPLKRLIEDRAYVYTLVDNYGHESAPSPPVFVSVDRNGSSPELGPTGGQTVKLEWDAIDQFVAGRSDITQMRVYRTVPGSGSSAFFFVRAVGGTDLTAQSLIDGALSTVVARNEILYSTGFYPPPDDLIGMVVMPNGFLAGFRRGSKDILFSEPYRPHAWPDWYTVSVEDEVVGLGVFDTTLAILTTGTPYLASGVHPDSISLTKLSPSNACLSRRSIVSMTTAVLYAAEDGLTAISLGGQQNLTEPLLTRDQWNTKYQPQNLRAARDGASTYVAFYDLNNGLEIDFASAERGVVDVSSSLAVTTFNADSASRRALIVSGRDVRRFNDTGATPVGYAWRSKEFFIVKPVNFGVCQINADASPRAIEGINPPPGGFVPTLQLQIWADGQLVYDYQVADRVNEPFRLLSGFKAQVWQFKLTGTMVVHRIVIAETERELSAN